MKTLPILCALILFSTMVCAQNPKAAAIDKALAVCEKKQGAYTRGEAECLSTALEAWEKDVADTYNEIRKLLSNDVFKSLEAGQRSWSEYRDQEFAFIGELFKNKRGTMFVPIRINYRIAIVKARALELETYAHRINRSQRSED